MTFEKKPDPFTSIVKNVTESVINSTQNVDSWNTIKMPFGKYKDMGLGELAKTNPGYLDWITKTFNDGNIKDAAINILAGKSYVQEEPRIKLSIDRGVLIIHSPFELKDRIKELPERKWNPNNKVWYSPISTLRQIIMRFPDAILDDQVKNVLEEMENVARLSDKASDKNIAIKFGEGLELMPFQAIGVKFIEENNGKALVADMMGLGKTIQALAYIRRHPELRPAIIVCPASLKINWQREATKWLESNEKVSIIGKTIESNQSIYIINYDIVSKHDLKNLNAKVLVLDESHYVKNYKAQRTKSVISLSEKIPNRILLTGTPILNRPNELWQQLNIIDPLKFKKFTTFAFRYCAPEQTGFGWDFHGASHIDELNDRLKTTMVRRLKSQVLTELPDKRRQTIILPLSNREIYNEAHGNFIQYLRSIGEAPPDAEHLVRIEGLKQLSIEGKMKAIISWIDNFLESGEKLVLFAWHIKTIKTLVEHYSNIAVSLTGESSMEARQIAVDNFQNNPNTKLFIGNIVSGGTGITLTASSNVAFIEFPWNFPILQQAEDRCHRITQKCAVNIYYLVGEKTIDEDIIEMILNKKNVIDAVMNGKVNIEESNNIMEIIKKYAKM